MKVNKNLFDECIDMECEIKRVCLNGYKGIPKELEKEARKIDGENYMESCFAIDINENGAMIVYMDEKNGYSEICKCDNWKEAEKYYDENIGEKK